MFFLANVLIFKKEQGVSEAWWLITNEDLFN